MMSLVSVPYLDDVLRFYLENDTVLLLYSVGEYDARTGTRCRFTLDDLAW